jgi:polyribonucleotide nucleotidyltransferase
MLSCQEFLPPLLYFNVATLAYNRATCHLPCRYEEAAKKAADHIMSLVEELQSMVTIALDVHPACHSKIIGRGGATIKALQSKHKVRVLMPREDGGPVKIEGSEKAALDCKDDILEMEEEWKQDEDEYDDDSMYVFRFFPSSTVTTSLPLLNSSRVSLPM